MTPFDPEKLCRTIVKLSGQKIASSGELKFLIGQQAAHDLSRKSAEQHTDQSAYTDFLAHQADFVKSVRAGKVLEVNHRSLDDFKAEYRLKATSSYEGCRQIAQETLPLAREIAERFCKIATKFSDDSLASEKAEHDKFGVPYAGPSTLVTWFRKAADFARARSQASPYQNASPAQLLPFLDLSEK